ncbi:hypothetical protein FFF34_001745 [Inquilinus sp. KBS0705]|nr:hypothetical protein FFF34_001745 [Inquilinus sp. KBS0705]
MEDYSNSVFRKIFEEVNDEEIYIIYSKEINTDLRLLKYFLTKKFYYAVIVDDYLLEISDKNSLLEALYYQVRLITMHSLNWDAMQEGLNDASNNFLEFKGICLLFKRNYFESTLKNEFKIMQEIIREINIQNNRKKIMIIINT